MFYQRQVPSQGWGVRQATDCHASAVHGSIFLWSKRLNNRSGGKLSRKGMSNDDG